MRKEARDQCNQLQQPLTPAMLLKMRVHAAPGADAGATYEKLAAVHLKLDSKHEAASSYMEAAKCYQKTDKKGALHMWLSTSGCLVHGCVQCPS